MGLFGDAQPRLFVYHFDNSQPKGYYTGFVPYTGSPAITAPISYDDGFYYYYGMVRYLGNWWFYWNGYWMGYLPASAWPQLELANPVVLQAGGEVASTNPLTCSWMGKGEFGGASAAYAYWSQTWFSHGGASYFLFPNGGYYASDPSAWTVGNTNAGIGALGYGGPGYAYPC